MKISLSPDYALRGWSHLPYAYLNLKTGEVSFVSNDDFQFLMKCDGKHVFSSSNQEKISRFKQLGVVRESNAEPSDEQLYVTYTSRFIRNVHWAITNKCNYECKHCFISAPHFEGRDVSHEECCKIIDELQSCGITQLSLTGGEPFIRKDILDLLEYALINKVYVKEIYSNGSLVTESLLHGIRTLGLDPIFHISFDGAKTHNWMRGVLDAEQRVRKSVKMIKSNNFRTFISCCLFSDNLFSLQSNLDVFSSLKVDKVNFGLINHLGEWKINAKNRNVSVEIVLEHILKLIPSIISRHYPFDINIAGFISIASGSFSYSIPEVKKTMNYNQLHNWVCCEKMRNTLYINPQGKLIGCEALTDSEITANFPNVLQTPLKDIIVDGNPFMDFIDQRLSLLINQNKECAQCEYLGICHGGCRGNACEQGDFWKEDNIACCFFKGGYYNKIKSLMEELNIPQI